MRDEKTAYGPLINQRAVDKVLRHVSAAKDGGAEILTGGTVHNGLVFQPTVIYNPPMSGPCWDEETFGPVAMVMEVPSFEEMLAIANESDYGLSAGVLTKDVYKRQTLTSITSR